MHHMGMHIRIEEMQKELLRDDEGACADWNKAVQLGAEGAKANIGICQ